MSSDQEQEKWARDAAVECLPCFCSFTLAGRAERDQTGHVNTCPAYYCEVVVAVLLQAEQRGAAELADSVLLYLESDHVLDNRFRLGALGAEDVASAIRRLRAARSKE